MYVSTLNRRDDLTRTSRGRVRGEPARGAAFVPPDPDDPLRPIAPALAEELYAAYVREASAATRSVLAEPAVSRAFRRQIDHLLIGLGEGLRRQTRVINPKKVALASPIGVFAAEVEPEILRGMWDDLFDTLAARMARIAEVLVGPEQAAGSLPTLTVLLQRAISARSHTSADWHDTAREHLVERGVEGERRRLARELHDWFGSNLTLAVRRLELYRASPEERHLDDAQDVLAELFQGVRRYAVGLRAQEPVGDVGSDLRAFVLAAGPDVPPVQVMVRGEDRHLTAEVREELFVVLREAVRNVHTHSRATRALVMVEISDDRACAVVQDDGVGLDAGHHPAGSSGMVSMRERVEGLRGQLIVTGAPGEGTRVELWIPIGGNGDGHGTSEER